MSTTQRVGEERAIDERGVDRTQIRAMLALTPRERLERLESMLASIVAIRDVNALTPAP